MKSLIKLAATGTALVSLSFAALTMAPVSADSPADIANGNIYLIKNLTQNVDFANPASAKAGDELEYTIRLHNTNYVAATDVNVAATLPTAASTSNTSVMTTTYTGGVTPGLSASATVNLTSSESLSYVTGSSELLDINGNVIKTLSDGVIGSGVNIGSLDGSTVEYVNFEVKVGTPTPPPAPTYACTDLGLTAEANRTAKISGFTTTATNGATFSNASINWGDNSSATTTATPVGQTHQYSSNGKYTVVATANFSVNGQTESATSVSCSQSVTFSSTTPPTVTPPTTTTPVTPAATPTTLVNTGAGSVFGIFAAVSLASTVVYRFIVKKNLSRI
jgi:hypothetical protein